MRENIRTNRIQKNFKCHPKSCKQTQLYLYLQIVLWKGSFWGGWSVLIGSCWIHVDRTNSGWVASAAGELPASTRAHCRLSNMASPSTLKQNTFWLAILHLNYLNSFKLLFCLLFKGQDMFASWTTCKLSLNASGKWARCWKRILSWLNANTFCRCVFPGGDWNFSSPTFRQYTVGNIKSSYIVQCD